MSIEDQYDAWVRGLMGSARASTKREADAAAQSVEEMQRALDEMTAQSQKRRTAAGKAADAVGRAADATMENVRRMSSELTASLKKDGPAGQRPRPPKSRRRPKNGAILWAWRTRCAPACWARTSLWARWSRLSAARL